MFSVTVRDRLMIAHSLSGEIFGPAARLHGATYVVDVELRRPDLDEHDVVVDIGLASKALRSVLAELDYRNLDDEPAFSGRNTTTEFLAKFVFDRMAEQIESGALGESARAMHSIRVTLRESHVAWAAYDGVLADRGGA